MGSGGGTQTSTQQTSAHLPGWENQYAKAYLSALSGLVFPGMTVPQNYFGANGAWSFPTSGPTDVAGSTGAAGASGMQPGASQPATANAVNYNLLDPMIASSPYLQNLAAVNPAGVQGAISPAAANQLGALYSSMGMG